MCAQIGGELNNDAGFLYWFVDDGGKLVGIS